MFIWLLNGSLSTLIEYLVAIAGTLRGRLSQLQTYAWAESTKRTREYQWRKYVTFCLRVKVVPIPMDYEIVSLFLLHMAMEGMAYSSINNELSALVTYAKLHRQEISLRKDFGIELTMMALRRILGDASNSKDEIYPGELLRVEQYADMTSYLQESVWLGILFLYRTMLRKCHVFWGETNDNLLRRRNVTFTEWGLVVRVTHTKTIQFRERVLEIPVCTDKGKLCLVTRLKAYFSKYPARLDDPILCRRNAYQLELVKYGPALKLFKDWCVKARIGKDIGMHSLRRGAATLMALAGFPLEDIKQRGDWRSMSVLKYLAYPMPQKISIDRKVGEFINNIC